RIHAFFQRFLSPVAVAYRQGIKWQGALALARYIELGTCPSPAAEAMYRNPCDQPHAVGCFSNLLERQGRHSASADSAFDYAQIGYRHVASRDFAPCAAFAPKGAGCGPDGQLPQ